MPRRVWTKLCFSNERSSCLTWETVSLPKGRLLFWVPRLIFLTFLLPDKVALHHCTQGPVFLSSWMQAFQVEEMELESQNLASGCCALSLVSSPLWVWSVCILGTQSWALTHKLTLGLCVTFWLWGIWHLAASVTGRQVLKFHWFLWTSISLYVWNCLLSCHCTSLLSTFVLTLSVLPSYELLSMLIPPKHQSM